MRGGARRQPAKAYSRTLSRSRAPTRRWALIVALARRWVGTARCHHPQQRGRHYGHQGGEPEADRVASGRVKMSPDDQAPTAPPSEFVTCSMPKMRAKRGPPKRSLAMAGVSGAVDA